MFSHKKWEEPKECERREYFTVIWSAYLHNHCNCRLFEVSKTVWVLVQARQGQTVSQTCLLTISKAFSPIASPLWGKLKKYKNLHRAKKNRSAWHPLVAARRRQLHRLPRELRKYELKCVSPTLRLLR